MKVLLVSTYELGHQPLHLAAPAASLRAAGHEIRTLDTSVEPWTREPVDWADAVAFSVPMHTAMRLALRAVAAVRTARPELPICLYGLYATVSRGLTLGPEGVVDRAIAGEYEGELVAWAAALAGWGPPPGAPAPGPLTERAARPAGLAGSAHVADLTHGAVVDLGRHRPAGA